MWRKGCLRGWKMNEEDERLLSLSDEEAERLLALDYTAYWEDVAR
jgi:hypothetical protein